MLIKAENFRIHYDLAGPESGAVVCFTHSHSADSGIWSEQVPALLARGYRVLRIDMRGHGGSGAPPGNYTMSELAGDVVRVLDTLGFAQVHYVGLSIGGMMGQVLALEHPQYLASLMLCGTSPATPPGGRALWEPRFAALDQAGTVEPMADATMSRWFTDTFKQLHPGRWQRIRDTIANVSPAGYRGCAEAILGYDVTAKLPQVNTPSLVLCGSEDAGTPPEGNRLIASLIPGARYHEIPGARHVPNAEFPDIFNSVLLDWLNSR